MCFGCLQRVFWANPNTWSSFCRFLIEIFRFDTTTRLEFFCHHVLSPKSPKIIWESAVHLHASWQETTRFWQTCMTISKFRLYRECRVPMPFSSFCLYSSIIFENSDTTLDALWQVPDLLGVWCRKCNRRRKVPLEMIFIEKIGETVDGSEIRRSPVDMVNILLFTGFHTCWVVQDFVHQQYDTKFWVSKKMMCGKWSCCKRDPPSTTVCPGDFKDYWCFFCTWKLKPKCREKSRIYVWLDHSYLYVIYWVVPPPSNSDHQDYYVFSRGSQAKPSFATGILGEGTTQVI